MNSLSMMYSYTFLTVMILFSEFTKTNDFSFLLKKYIAVHLDAIINVKIEAKKLRLSQDKCYKIHINKQPVICNTKEELFPP